MRPVDVDWPAQDKEAIAFTQSVSAAGKVVLRYPYYKYAAVSRSVSITSANDLSAVSFTITGYYKGQLVSKTIQGPNNDTVDTSTGTYNGGYPNLSEDDVIFDMVTEVSTNAPANDFSVGTGLYGHTLWVNGDYFQAIAPVSVEVIVYQNDMCYSLGVTFQDVTTTPDHLLFLMDASGGNMNNSSESKLNMFFGAYRYLAIFINSNNGNPSGNPTNDTGALKAVVINPGNGTR